MPRADRHSQRKLDPPFHRVHWQDWSNHHTGSPVIEGKSFALVYEELIHTTTITGWGDALLQQAERPVKPPKRVKFTCTSCSFNAYAVPSATGRLACVPCGNRVMVAE